MTLFSSWMFILKLKVNITMIFFVDIKYSTNEYMHTHTKSFTFQV